MATPKHYANNYIPVKYMLSSYRALADGRSGIRHLEHLLAEASYLLSEWKIVWNGTCTTLRTSIDLFQRDARFCLSEGIKEEIKAEWKLIKDNAQAHPIYWEFLKKERDSIVHEYAWTAYEAWLEPDGTVQSPPTILGRILAGSEARPKLLMNSGQYAGQDSIELLHQAADWVEARIFNAIERAGFDPQEKRGIYDFREMPSVNVEQLGLLARYASRNA